MQRFVSMTGQLPRRAARSIDRKTVGDWLRRHADVAVRLIVAPPGFGKTTALAAYIETPTARRRIYLSVAERTSRDDFATTIARELGERRACTASAVSALLTASAPVEILVDDLHLANSDMRAAFDEIVADVPAGVFFIIASQRRDRLEVGALFARGLIAVCDQSELAFDAAEIRTLCALAGITAAAADIDALADRSGGWPPAVIGTLDEFAREPQTLAAAYESWRSRWTVPAIDLVSSLLERVPLAERTATRRHFAHGGVLDQHTLAVLHRHGFFVQFDGSTFSLVPWVDELYPATGVRQAERPTLAVGLFGRFTADVNGVPIVWARRRDQHIVKYLALHPHASVTRAELAQVFWPDTARPLAMQNLRTACSTIRRAIGNVVGIENVDHYFIAGERLTLNRAAIVCDVDRFRNHVALAQPDEEAVPGVEAIAHLCAAERLYGNGLFAGDVREPAFLNDAQELAAMYAGVLGRLSGALIERGSPDMAREYAAKALKFGFFRDRAAGTHVHLRVAAS